MMVAVKTGRSSGAGLAALWECPLCGCPPVEPVRVDGQCVCRSCADTCSVCGRACVPGDDACGECIRQLAAAGEAVPA